MKCPKCNKEIKSQFSEKEKLHYYFCNDCKIGGKGKTEKDAGEKFISENSGNAGNNTESNYLITIPKKKTDLPVWALSNMQSLVNNSAQFIEKPATRRMIEKNIKYVMSLELKDAWSSPEGQESISDALQDSFEIGAILPEMGSIVQFGKTAEFIPSISAYQFALTSGKNPPFSNISIDCIYENDQYSIGRKDGNFSFVLEKVGFPRGEVVGVVVQANENNSDRIIGEAYDEKRLMQKAEKHSKSYKYYLNDLRLLAEARTKGKDFFEKKPGWKVYEKDIENPYVGADKPEMLKKLAGKSFFSPYMKVRNARAMDAEWTETEESPGDICSSKRLMKDIDKITTAGLSQVKDAVIVEDEENGVPIKNNEKEVKKEKLFDEE